MRRRALIGEQDSGNQIINGANLVWEQGTIDTSGVPAESDYIIRTADYIPVEAGKYIRYTGEIKDANNVRIYCYVVMYDSNNNLIERPQILASTSTVAPSISIPVNCEKVKFFIGHSDVAMIPAYGEIFTASVGGNKTHLVASLYNHAMEVADSIWTGVTPLKSDFNLTILLDYDVVTNQTSGAGRYWKPIYCYHSILGNIGGMTVGKSGANSTLMSVWWMGSSAVAAGGTTVNAGRHRLALVHTAGSGELMMYYRKNTGTKYTFTYNETFTASPSNILYLGGSNGLPGGTINKMEIYDTILDSATINAFFA